MENRDLAQLETTLAGRLGDVDRAKHLAEAYIEVRSSSHSSELPGAAPYLPP